jgi:alpha-tubulin suppressor-like RCC1 family protein
MNIKKYIQFTCIIIFSLNPSFAFTQTNSWFVWGNNSSGVFGNGNSGSAKWYFNPTTNKSLDTFKMLHLGGYSVYGIDKNDELWAWGDNGLKGKLGLNSDKSAFDTPQKIDGNNKWMCVSTWDYLNAGIQKNGKLYAWGRFAGYPDSISAEDRPVDKVLPVLLSNDTDWIDLKVGWFHILALKSNGTLWSIGENKSGELGIPGDLNKTLKKPHLVMYDIKFIETRGQTCFAIDKSNRLWTWGANVSSSKITDGGTEYYIDSTYYTIPHLVNNHSNWKEVKTNGARVLGLKNDGALWSWGVNYYGQLGTGDFNNRDTPVRITSNQYWKSISISYENSFALDSQGFLWSWGKGSPELGLGFGAKEKNTPQKIESDSGWQNILSGSLYCMALKTEVKKPVLQKTSLIYNNLKISPNPTNSDIAFYTEGQVGNQTYNMNIFDLSGRVVKSEVAIDLVNYKYNIKEYLGSGIFIINLQSDSHDYKLISKVIVY